MRGEAGGGSITTLRNRMECVTRKKPPNGEDTC